jgi:hypothetical protein
VPLSSRATRTVALRVGSLATASTAGALLGFGWRLGTPVRPFNAVARLLLGARADGVWGPDPLVTVAGVLLHVTVMHAWGFAYVWLARHASGWRRSLIAVAVAATALAVDLLVVERWLQAGVSGVLTGAQVVAVHLVLAVTLALGMRFATSDLRHE